MSKCISTALFTLIAAYTLWEAHSPSKKRRRIRQKLPPDLYTWRQPGNSHEAEEKIWIDLEEIFRGAGFTLWPHAFWSHLFSPGKTFPLSSGFGYAIPFPSASRAPGSLESLREFDYINPLQRACRMRDGHDVIVRVVVLGGEGHEHLKILRRIATGTDSLLTTNHVLPMLSEFQFEDITFGIFPKAGASLTDAYGDLRNSVGDIVEMIMQMLEALSYIHNLKIAHRDAFRDNFVIQWHPESLRPMKISPSRPRVYLIDFEVAIQFPSECPLDQCTTTGFPLGGSFTNSATYGRLHPPEFTSGKPYSPFKLDIWQLGTSLNDFKSTIPDIDEILNEMINTDPVHRMNAGDILEKMSGVVHSMPMESLLIEPVVLKKA